MKTNKTLSLAKIIAKQQFVWVLGLILLMWLLEGISVWVFNMLDTPKPLPMVMNIADMTSYIFFLFGLTNFALSYKWFLVHGLTRRIILKAYILSTIVSVSTYTIIMGGIMLVSNLDLTSDLLVYHLIKLFFDGFISFLLGSMIMFGFYRSKKLGVVLILPALIGLSIKIYIWLGLSFYGSIDPSINGPRFNIVESVLASIIFSSILYFILKFISKKMPIKI